MFMIFKGLGKKNDQVNKTLKKTLISSEENNYFQNERE